ncbi:hypothetical protein Pcinc_014689 [Petrolisthes cinctipes]|uniref:Uncharacterized protein n=1 Tax=Petrolisthes cinctipes TaxID=88211 RepID=A0AAE1FWG5_PETCI|nr:hypothetical protein Pcinc_014689 [Petrolisthes cinctipes]
MHPTLLHPHPTLLPSQCSPVSIPLFPTLYLFSLKTGRHWSRPHQTHTHTHTSRGVYIRGPKHRRGHSPPETSTLKTYLLTSSLQLYIKMARMLLVVGVVAACVALVSASCVKFCNHPNGRPGKYLCCDENPGSCPPVRDICPKFAAAADYESRPCTFDPECGTFEKCCFDICEIALLPPFVTFPTIRPAASKPVPTLATKAPRPVFGRYNNKGWDGSHVAGGDCGGGLCGTGVGKLCQFLPGS